MKNVCCDKVEQKSSRGDIEVGGLWEPYKSEKGVIAAYCLNFGHFSLLSHPLGGLGTTYDVIGLIEKRVVDLLLVLIELFSLDITAESLYE